jgi:hypothetical protein
MCNRRKIAKRAANTLFALKGSAIWRRYVIIAFEDIHSRFGDCRRNTLGYRPLA